MNVTNVPSRLRRYRANNPYSHTLLFFFLEAAWSVLKIVLVGTVLFALWVVSNKWMASQQKPPQEAAVLVEESSKQLESAEVGSDDETTDIDSDAIGSDDVAADIDSDAIETDLSTDTKIAVNAKPETSVSPVPIGNTAVPSDSATEVTGTNVDTAERRVLKISAYSAVLFSSISNDDAKQTPIDKDSTVLFIERQGEWIKVKTADTQDVGYVHSSHVIAD